MADRTTGLLDGVKIKHRYNKKINAGRSASAFIETDQSKEAIS